MVAVRLLKRAGLFYICLIQQQTSEVFFESSRSGFSVEDFRSFRPARTWPRYLSCFASALHPWTQGTSGIGKPQRSLRPLGFIHKMERHGTHTHETRCCCCWGCCCRYGSHSARWSVSPAARRRRAYYTRAKTSEVYF